MSDSFYNSSSKLAPGALIVNTLGDITLTNPAAHYISAEADNVSDFNLILPSMNQPNSWTLGSTIVIYNGSTLYNLTVKDNSSNTVITITPLTTAFLYVKDNSTSDGVWGTQQDSGTVPYVITSTATNYTTNGDNLLLVTNVSTGAPRTIALSDTDLANKLQITIKDTTTNASDLPIHIISETAGLLESGLPEILLAVSNGAVTLKSDGVKWTVLSGTMGEFGLSINYTANSLSTAPFINTYRARRTGSTLDSVTTSDDLLQLQIFAYNGIGYSLSEIQQWTAGTYIGPLGVSTQYRVQTKVSDGNFIFALQRNVEGMYTFGRSIIQGPLIVSASASTQGAGKVFVNNTSPAVTITISDIQKVAGVNIEITDISGTASVNPITIVGETFGVLFNGLPSATITADYGTARLTSDGINFFY